MDTRPLLCKESLREYDLLRESCKERHLCKDNKEDASLLEQLLNFVNSPELALALLRITEGGEVAKVVAFTVYNFAEQPAHNFS